MLPSKLAKHRYLLVFLPIVAFYLYGLGHIPFVGPDEPRYVEVAREMFLNHDLITPTLGGHTWFEKPVLLYWMIDAAFRLFGISEWSARLGPALCGVLTMFAVYVAGRRIEALSHDPQLSHLGHWSALILASMPGMIVFSRGASFDIVITMTLTWALTFFLLAELEDVERKRRLLLVGFYAFIGISLLAKGLIGIVIPAGVIVIYHLLRRSFFKRYFLTSVVWGLPLVLAVAASWYGPVIARNGWPFIDQFFIQHHFARYLSNKYHHPQPVYYYLLVIFPLALPWLAFAVLGVIRSRNWDWRGDSPVDRLRVFALSWILAPLIFFSFSGSKLPGYILPILPAIALLGGERLTRTLASRQASWTMRIVAGILSVYGLGAIGYGFSLGVLPRVSVVLIAAPLIVAGTMALGFETKRVFAALLMLFAIPLSVVISLSSGVPALAESYSSRGLIARANERGYSTAPIYSLHEIDRTAEFYGAGRLLYDAQGEPVRLEGATQALESARQLNQPILVLVPVKYVAQLTALQSAAVEVIADNGVMAIVGLRSLK